jgi:purine-binding chemotaxis protein CheW
MSEAKIQSTASDCAGVKKILQARARALACKPKSCQADGAAIEVIEFRLAKERYAVERDYVREVYPLKEMTPVPCTPAFMLGVVNVRGQMVPVIDIKKFFDLPETGITDMHRVIILHAADVEVGVLADADIGARSIPLTSIQASLPTLTGIRAQYLKGVSDPHTVILDAARILADPKIVVNEEVET